MNKQELFDEITKLKERLNELEKMYDSLKLPNKRWRAKKDEYYFFILPTGTVRSSIEAKMEIDNIYYAFGNYFKTQEEAEFEAERLKVIAELREWATPVDEFDWNAHGEYKYILKISNNGGFCLRIGVWESYQYSDLVFASEEIARNAIEAVGEERIIKYYFRKGVGTNKN